MYLALVLPVNPGLEVFYLTNILYMTTVNDNELPTLQYPVGQYQKPEKVSPALFDEWKEVIRQFPELLQAELAGITPEEEENTYRPGGWTIRQVVHHCADSHMNSFIRFKLALTEKDPVIKPYFEERWSDLPDVLTASLDSSLQIIKGLHARWSLLLESLSEEETKRCFVHPEQNRAIPLWEATALYAWHCRHHLAHVKQAKGMPPLV